MPELPEVETTCRGVGPHLRGQRITALIIRQRRLRWPIPAELEANVVGQHLGLMERRAKYLLLPAGGGHIIIHLGMSGSLRLVAASEPAGFHDHVDIVLANGSALRLRDPRRFGAVLWITGSPTAHPLLAQLGPEPLSDRFDGDYLYSRSHGRKVAIKQFLMDGKIVVGVGNIYANEALFAAGISPTRAAGRVSQERYRLLASAVKAVLGRAIEHGGTTLRDFVDGSGKPGYFRTELQVYGREGLACVNCKEVLTSIRIGQRATVYCKNCQR